MTATIETTTWCTDHRGPGYDPDGRIDELDFHRKIIANIDGIGDVSVDCDDEHPELSVYYGEDLYDASTVRAFGVALIEAADLMDKINAGVSA